MHASWLLQYLMSINDLRVEIDVTEIESMMEDDF